MVPSTFRTSSNASTVPPEIECDRQERRLHLARVFADDQVERAEQLLIGPLQLELRRAVWSAGHRVRGPPDGLRRAIATAQEPQPPAAMTIMIPPASNPDARPCR